MVGRSVEVPEGECFHWLVIKPSMLSLWLSYKAGAHEGHQLGGQLRHACNFSRKRCRMRGEKGAEEMYGGLGEGSYCLFSNFCPPSLSYGEMGQRIVRYGI